MKHGRVFLLVCFAGAAASAVSQSSFDEAWSRSAMTHQHATKNLSKSAKSPVTCAGSIAYNEQAASGPSVKYCKIPKNYLNTNRVVDRIAALISSNEGDPTDIDWNDCGKGVSVGMFQANQKVGILPDLFQKLAGNTHGREELKKVFGPAVADKVATDPAVVRTLAFKPNNGLGKGLQQLTQSKAFQKLQVQVLRKNIVTAVKLAHKHGIHSAAGVAIAADLANQWGPAGADKWLGCHPKTNDEMVRLQAIVKAVNASSKYGARYQGDLQKAVANNLSFTQPLVLDEAAVVDASSESDPPQG